MTEMAAVEFINPPSSSIPSDVTPDIPRVLRMRDGSQRSWERQSPTPAALTQRGKALSVDLFPASLLVFLTESLFSSANRLPSSPVDTERCPRGTWELSNVLSPSK